MQEAAPDQPGTASDPAYYETGAPSLRRTCGLGWRFKPTSLAIPGKPEHRPQRPLMGGAIGVRMRPLKYQRFKIAPGKSPSFGDTVALPHLANWQCTNIQVESRRSKVDVSIWTPQRICEDHPELFHVEQISLNRAG